MARSEASQFDQIPDALWERIDLVLPIYKTSCKGGRPRLPLRIVVCGILYVLRTGCQWKVLRAVQNGGGWRLKMVALGW